MDIPVSFFEWLIPVFWWFHHPRTGWREHLHDPPIFGTSTNHRFRFSDFSLENPGVLELHDHFDVLDGDHPRRVVFHHGAVSEKMKHFKGHGMQRSVRQPCRPSVDSRTFFGPWFMMLTLIWPSKVRIFYQPIWKKSPRKIGGGSIYLWEMGERIGQVEICLFEHKPTAEITHVRRDLHWGIDGRAGFPFWKVSQAYFLNLATPEGKKLDSLEMNVIFTGCTMMHYESRTQNTVVKFSCVVVVSRFSDCRFWSFLAPKIWSMISGCPASIQLPWMPGHSTAQRAECSGSTEPPMDGVVKWGHRSSEVQNSRRVSRRNRENRQFWQRAKHFRAEHDGFSFHPSIQASQYSSSIVGWFLEMGDPFEANNRFPHEQNDVDDFGHLPAGRNRQDWSVADGVGQCAGLLPPVGVHAWLMQFPAFFGRVLKGPSGKNRKHY